MSDWPKIVARRVTKVSPWMDVIARDVEFAPGKPAQTWHAVGQADYVAILALTADKRIPIVRQFRPALEAYTWELPAGLVDRGEDAAESCRRELLEETGFPALKVYRLGVTAPCSARLSNRIHSFFVQAGKRSTKFKPEPDITVQTVTPAELAGLIKNGAFVSQLHIGTLMLARMRSFLDLPI